MKKRKRRPSVRQKLAIAEARLSAFERLLYAFSTRKRRSHAAKFIQCWPVSRGYSAITQALDEDGQVWERHLIVEKSAEGSKVTDEWWAKISMEKR